MNPGLQEEQVLLASYCVPPAVKYFIAKCSYKPYSVTLFGDRALHILVYLVIK